MCNVIQDEINNYQEGRFQIQIKIFPLFCNFYYEVTMSWWMNSGMGTISSNGLNKGFGLKFPESYWLKILEEH